MRTLVLSFLLTLACALNLSAQGMADSPRIALNNAFEKGNLMAALSGYQWRRGLNLAAAHLTVGQSISLNLTLQPGVDYAFLASGPTEATDVDLYLRDNEGKLLFEDFEDDGTPILEFQVTTGGSYQVQMHLAAGVKPDAYVALSLLRKRGRQISEQDYRSIAKGFFAAAEKIVAASPGANWQKKTGEWCLFGFCLDENEGATLRELRPQAGKNLFAAATGPSPSEITLYLASEAGRIVGGNNRPEAYPLLRYDAPPGALIDLRVSAVRAKAHILALVGVLHQ